VGWETRGVERTRRVGQSGRARGRRAEGATARAGGTGRGKAAAGRRMAAGTAAVAGLPRPAPAAGSARPTQAQSSSRKAPSAAPVYNHISFE